jgi:biopolymer transport protein ExbD
MLLTFFLVTSSMDTDKGLPRQLPPPQDETQEQELMVKERNVLEIGIDDKNQLTVGGEVTNMKELQKRVELFVENAANDPQLPEKSTREVNLLGRTQVSDRHIIAIQVSRKTSYNTYFEMQNAIVAAYNHLRSQLALKHFGHSLAKCSTEERDAVSMVYPQRISEQQPTP